MKAQDETTDPDERTQVALRVMALQSINDAKVGRDSSQYPNKTMPAAMQEQWEYGSSQTDVEEHITKLEDWLILAPPNMHVRFIFMTLSGNTRELFRKHFHKHPEMTSEQAKQWLRDNLCV